ncbi:MAG: sigma-70 family RNA polymerase sigma factor [Planctomycetes bacterium]|nr:sigma-70 family RNA polymerase sigma factor [Planctomycetota bacterium]
MPPAEFTCWTMVRGAASGNPEDRDLFARKYTPVIRSYLEARWRDSPLEGHVDDGVQEVFVECFKEGGVLDCVEEIRLGSFRRFLHGVVRNVALRFEDQQARAREGQAEDGYDFDAIARREETLSKLFDRAWARTVLDEAVAVQVDRAKSLGEAALRRVELLHLRFHEGLPIREIARRWDANPDVLHEQFRQARNEFRAALFEVVAFENPGSAESIEREVEEIIAILTA